MARDYGLRFEILAVADSSGSATREGGFDLESLLAAKSAGGAVRDLEDGRAETGLAAVLPDLGCDLVFEASPLNLETGGVGLEIARAAFERGVSVVLANKGPLVVAFAELEELAHQNQAGLAYSATVCGGLPVLAVGRRDLIAGEIRSLRGIFNSTSNFVLESLSRGASLERAVGEARRRGIAEADPSLDLGGWDTAAKLTIVANSLLDAGIGLDQVEVTGLEDLDPELPAREAANGRAVRLMAEAADGRYRVEPQVLPLTDFLGACAGWEMGVELETDIYGVLSLKLWEREPVPTAAAMMRDAVQLFGPVSPW